ncbi:hypothetical protein IAT40_007588 [Kwoniella sp. CBS 6097]
MNTINPSPPYETPPWKDRDTRALILQGQPYDIQGYIDSTSNPLPNIYGVRLCTYENDPLSSDLFDRIDIQDNYTQRMVFALIDLLAPNWFALLCGDGRKAAKLIYQARVKKAIEFDQALPPAQRVLSDQARAELQTWMAEPHVLRGILQALEHPDDVIDHTHGQARCSGCSRGEIRKPRAPADYNEWYEKSTKSSRLTGHERRQKIKENNERIKNGTFLDIFSPAAIAQRKQAEQARLNKATANGTLTHHDRQMMLAGWDRAPPAPLTSRDIPNLPCVTVRGDDSSACACCIAKRKHCSHA